MVSKSIAEQFRSSRFNDGWDAYGNAVRGHIANYYGVCSNRDIVAYRDRAENLGDGADVHIVANHRRPRVFDASQTDDYSVPYSTVIAEFGVSAYYDTAEMVNYKVTTDLHFAR